MLAPEEDDTAEDGDPNENADKFPPDGAAEISVYDEIGGWGISATDFDRALKALGDIKQIALRINSPGGDPFAGIAIHNMLVMHPANVTTHVDGIAASAASLIAMAGNKIIMPANTFMVVHEPLALTIGPAAAHRAMADDLDRVSEAFANVYSNRTKQPVEDVRSLMAEDRLMSAQEAKDKGYADVMTDAMPMVATFDLDRIPEKHRGMIASTFVPAAAAVTTAPLQGTPGSAGTATSEPAAAAAPVVEAAAAPAVVAAAPAAPAYGEADASETLALCAIANMPAAFAQKMIADKTPIAKVRERLLEARAADADRLQVSALAANDDRSAGGDVVAGKRRLQAILKTADKKRVSLDEAARIVDRGQQ